MKYHSSIGQFRISALHLEISIDNDFMIRNDLYIPQYLLILDFNDDREHLVSRR